MINRIQCDTIIKYFMPKQDKQGREIRDQKGELAVDEMKQPCRGKAKWKVDEQLFCTDCMIRYVNEQKKDGE